MSRIEFVSPEGLRVDGRRPNELRRVKCKMGVLPGADGSASFQMGNTVAIASVRGPREARGVAGGASAVDQEGIVAVEYSLATFSTRERRRRVRDRATSEISQALSQTLAGVVQVHLFPRSAVDVAVRIVQSDGGNRACALNATVLALADAGVPMKDVVCCCSAGCIDGTPLLDLNFIEESAGGPDVPLALLAHSGKIALLQMEAKLPADTFRQVVALASTGCRGIFEAMSVAMRTYVSDSLDRRGSVAKVVELS